MKTTVWSFGGGMQSAAIGVLIVQGRLPTPDLAVIADTGREAESTWAYLRDVMQPYLGDRITIERIPRSLSTVDLYSKSGDLLIPAFTPTGALPKFCSEYWKREVVGRYLRTRGVSACDVWLGISVDELERMRTDTRARWMHKVYPLVDLRLTRWDCTLLIQRAGLPVPKRSACWMCPYRSNADWRALSQGDMDKAVALETALRAKDANVYLHPSRKPLGEVDFEEPANPQVELFCETGFCWT